MDNTEIMDDGKEIIECTTIPIDEDENNMYELEKKIRALRLEELHMWRIITTADRELSQDDYRKKHDFLKTRSAKPIKYTLRIDVDNKVYIFHTKTVENAYNIFKVSPNYDSWPMMPQSFKSYFSIGREPRNGQYKLTKFSSGSD